MTGGAVQAACAERPAARCSRGPRQYSGRPVDALGLDDGRWSAAAERRAGLARRRAGQRTPIEETVEWRHRTTEPIDPETGQGFAHVQYAFAAHRAVVDVDVELGLVKVVELACTQDVGKAINPDAVVGQIQGGSTQGLGLALMEEIQISRRARSATRRSPTT